MKVLLVNYRYFVSGGPERYLFNLKTMLEENGHETVPFSVDYQENIESEYKKYFVSPPGLGNSAYFRNMQFSKMGKVKAGLNSVYSFGSRKKFNELVDAENPDFAFFLLLHNTLTSSVLDASISRNIPTVVRLSDYYLLCPKYTMYRNNHICEECTQNLFSVVKHKCIHNELLPSIAKYFTLQLERLTKVYERVDRIICPSEFLYGKLIENGFSAEKLVHIPTPVFTEKLSPWDDNLSKVVYMGRITEEKGVYTLIKAMETLDLELIVIGDDSTEEGIKIKSYIQSNDLKNIILVGFKSKQEATEIIKNCAFAVCPSEWYENTPNVIYECMALGKPVIGSNIGSIKEQIDDKQNGLLFETKNHHDLRSKIVYLRDNPKLRKEMGKNARHYVETTLNPELHIKKIMSLIQS